MSIALDWLTALRDKEPTEEDIDFARFCLDDEEPLVRCEAVWLIGRSDYFNEKDIEKLLLMSDDEEVIVRTEVYDWLSVHGDEKVVEKLKDMIISEDDIVGRAYAISAWADTRVSIADENYAFEEETGFIRSIRDCELIQESEHTQLACAYALYSFKAPGALDQILSFLKSEDYHIQCSAINDLMRVLRREDAPEVRMALSQLMETEPCRAVSSLIDEFFEEYKEEDSEQ